MRILLLNPPFHPRYSRCQRSPARTRSGNLYYPIWLGYAAGVLDSCGHQVFLIDAPARGFSVNVVLDAASRIQPHLVVVETSTGSIENDLEVSRAVRLTVGFESVIVLVGPHVSACARATLTSAPWIDGVARREYDFTLRDLAAAISGGSSIDQVPGLTCRIKGEILDLPDRPFIQPSELDAIPFVSSVWSRHVVISDYRYSITPHPEVTILTGRGCPYRCSFCLWPQVLTGHQYRRRSIENVVAEFLWIQENLPGKHVFLEDDTLTVDRPRCRKLAAALIDAGSKVTFTANSRADVDYETLRVLKASGLRMLCTGFESGADNILKAVEKRLEVSRGQQFMQDARRAGVLVHGCFMVGNPGETLQSLRDTLDMACSLNPDSAQFFPLMAYPGTRAYNKAVETGDLPSGDYSRWLTPEGYHNSLVRCTGVGDVDISRWCDHARRVFYLRPAYLIRKADQCVRHPSELKRNVRSAYSLVRASH